MLDMQAQLFSQGVNYDRIFEDGSRHQIHLRITLSHATPITRERRAGFLKEAHIKSGDQQLPSHYSGFMENVRPCPIPRHLILILIRSWLREEYTLVRRVLTFFLLKDN